MSDHTWHGVQRLGSRQLLQSVLIGGSAGFIATLPMTLAIVVLHRWLPRRERFSWPPHIVTHKATRHTGMRRPIDKSTPLSSTLVAHFGFGSVTGAVYGLLARGLPPRPILAGSLYGLLVWMSSYLCWLPITGLYHPPDREPPRRHAMMIVAHLVWEPILGVLVHQMEHRHVSNET